ncbi:MAG TPA: DUF1549 domain-containing protein [Planctomicrobium sp.]|nr:DUF1549 domain-containing protein [Planctomicrobium sp.]
MRSPLITFGCLISLTTSVMAFDNPQSPADSASPAVSFHKQIRPLLQAHCQGCHQPAKASGGYVLTSFTQFTRPGESGDAPVVPGKPDESALLTMITPVDGSASMPPERPPLSAAEISLIRQWIEQGAKDDSPANLDDQINQANPPVYQRPPVVTSLEYSPDGNLLAVSGFHEAILLSNETQQLATRLIGISERVESVSFSPDGKRLAIAGGLPSRQGEVQIWNIETGKLDLSIPTTFDTVYGVSWSPDGKMVAVGCSDTAVRGFDTTTGKQVFYNGAHDDWPLDTVFSTDGSLLVSVGRDMSTKLYNVPTERFIDNVTSITPGALKGGISAVAKRPERDEILVGGSDGVPRIYRMERVSTRRIGDDANLIRRYPGIPGRITAVAYHPDGKTFACASSLDGQGHVAIYTCDVAFEMPEEIKKIVEKVASSQSPEEKAKLEEYVTKDASQLASLTLSTPVFALTYHPQGERLAVAGGDGLIRFLDAKTAEQQQEVQPFPIVPEANDHKKQESKPLAIVNQEPLSGTESLPADAQVTKLEVSPENVTLRSPYDSTQVLVTGVLATGDRIDLTRLAKLNLQGDAATLSQLGRIYPQKNGTSQLTVSFGDQKITVPISVEQFDSQDPLRFIRDVNPVLTRLGCNQGTCHGAQDGKAGFKLSLRGYDPLFDVRSFTDDLKGRRTNVASPDQSLMLLKASGTVPHMGGQLTRPGEAYYEIIRRWIAEGATLDLESPRVTSISIEPQNSVVQQIGARQQLRVIATYSDGIERDVTGDAYLESGNTEVAESNRAGVITALRRGEAPILARFEGSYAATTLTVMGDRGGFVWQEPEIWSPIDELVARKWERMKILPSGLARDEDFLRRVYLDLTGLPPSSDEVVQFLQDTRPTREKRDAVIDRLIGSEAFVEYWTNKWADLLQVNSKFLGGEGATLFRQWIRKNVAENRRYDEFCYDILTATGSNKENPPASYYKILREPTETMENTTHLFLGVRFNCNKCHDHPFERWTQDQYYQTTAFFAQVDMKRDPKNANGNIGGSAVEGAKPLWEEIFDKNEGEILHDRTKAVTAPLAPYNRELEIKTDGKSRREQLAAWITDPGNDYFARSYANRVWGYMMGIGLIEPLDDIRAGNPPTNPELLDLLTTQFVETDFNVRELMRMICKSRVYQLEVGTNQWNEDDRSNYSHAVPKRLPAEVLYDAVYTATGSKMRIPGVPEGTRAAALPDVQINLADGFLANLGRPVRESACECERSADLQLGPVMALMNGTTVSDAISQSGNRLDKLASSETDMNRLVDQVFLNILNRHARPEEIQATILLMNDLQSQHAELVTELNAYRELSRPVQEEKEKRRLQAVALTEKAIEEYKIEIQPKVDADEAARLKAIAEAQKKRDDFLATTDARVAEWEKTAPENPTPWSPLSFKDRKATNGANLKQEDDQVIMVKGKNGKGAYILQTSVTLDQVAALRLEALSDPQLPGKGPGRSAGGNFVLSELTVEYWPINKPDEKKVAKLQNAQADFSQNGYAIETAIDGKSPASGNGWAVSPEVGKDHFATFELAEPVTSAQEFVFQVTMDQQYTDATHSLGKFRVSFTDKAGPVNFGLPAAVSNALAVAVEERTEEQKQALGDYVNRIDTKLADLNKALTDAEKPVPEEPHLTELKGRLSDYQKPLPADPQLVRLERAVQLGEGQLQNARLTAVQDLAWALINSPAFLFNR